MILNNKNGSCEIIYGPMFSGKTTKLLTDLTRYADVGINCLYINHTLDDRSKNNFSTHNSIFTDISKKLNNIKVSELKNLNIENYDVIGIDEGQFFIDINDIVRKWVLYLNKTVIISSLDGDFEMNLFGEVYKLIPISYTISKQNAICTNCMEKFGKHNFAHFSAKLNNNSTVSQIEIGGREKYTSLCLECYKKHNIT